MTTPTPVSTVTLETSISKIRTCINIDLLIISTVTGGCLVIMIGCVMGLCIAQYCIETFLKTTDKLVEEGHDWKVVVKRFNFLIRKAPGTTVEDSG